ncbi:MAG: MOSC domain-containing protein [Chloroflexi bacterium]|jgi:MOSC domain-containing protein YiiM|nr:MOSC domain-containing protein [Chloroflexota bacterium]
MWQGEIVAIHVASAAAAPMRPVEEVRAVPGRGLEGDRYFAGQGTYSAKAGPHREVTLIELEALEAIQRDAGITLGLAESRRNLVTRGVPLSHLVGREFLVGTVRLRGIKLCEPCLHMERLSGRAGVCSALVHRGGLNAQVLEEGVVRVGDVVRPAE